MQGEHIVKAYDQELERLHTTIAEMGGLAESQLSQAIKAVIQRDSGLANQIVDADRQVDALEQQVDAMTVRMLALRQPVAEDLRAVIAALKIASELERIADYAKNVAKRCVALNQLPATQTVSPIGRMGRLAEQMIKDVLDAYLNGNTDLAMEVWRRDEELDAMYTSLFRELLTYMMEDARTIGTATHLLFIAKNIERIGDHTTNIAELIHYKVTGGHIEEPRPKGDSSSGHVVQPPEGTDSGQGGDNR